MTGDKPKHLPAHIDRVVTESIELSKKISKLEAALGNSLPGATSVETSLLEEQLGIMKMYSIVLKKRIALYT